METIKSSISRKEVINKYLEYDCKKKNKKKPDTSAWEWDNPNWLDNKLESSGFKKGILPGYTKWNFVELTLTDIRDCAIKKGIIKSESQCLKDLELESKKLISKWKPCRDTQWFGQLSKGIPLCKQSFLILRKAVNSEKPANYYLEDGSGRGLAIIQNADKYKNDTTVAFAYVGIKVDQTSLFMNANFKSLLKDVV